jgi:hypothetical protein
LAKHDGGNLECINKSYCFLDAFVGYFTTILQTCWVHLSRKQYPSHREVISNCMEQSSRRESCSPVTQRTPRVLLNPNVHFHIHNSPPIAPVLNQINLLQVLTLLEAPFQYYLDVYACVLQVTSFHQSPHQTLYAPLLSTKLVTFTAHLICLDVITRITFGNACRKAPHYEISIISRSPFAQISSSVPFSRTASAHIFPSQ